MHSILCADTSYFIFRVIWDIFWVIFFYVSFVLLDSFGLCHNDNILSFVIRWKWIAVFYHIYSWDLNLWYLINCSKWCWNLFNSSIRHHWWHFIDNTNVYNNPRSIIYSNIYIWSLPKSSTRLSEQSCGISHLHWVSTQLPITWLHWLWRWYCHWNSRHWKSIDIYNT